jgi:hypothetical protein
VERNYAFELVEGIAGPSKRLMKKGIKRKPIKKSVGGYGQRSRRLKTIIRFVSGRHL